MLNVEEEAEMEREALYEEEQVGDLDGCGKISGWFGAPSALTVFSPPPPPSCVRL